MIRRIGTALTLLSALVPHLAGAQLVPLGGQFQVNSYTTNLQAAPVVRVAPSGQFVVAWQSYGSPGTDTASSSIQAQRYDAKGAPVGSQFQVNSYTTSFQSGAAVAGDAAGNFVVAWQSYGGAATDTDSFSIQAQRYDATGAPVGGQFQVNSYTTSFQVDASVAADAAGNFVVVWRSNGGLGADTDISIQAQRYDATGTPVGSQFQVNSYTTNYQFQPAIAMNADGAFVVAWSSFEGDGSDPDLSVQAQRYDATGSPVGGQFQVNSYTTYGQYYPSATIDADGNFLVAWTSLGSAGSDTDSYSVQAQRYDTTGAPVGGEFQVNSYTTSVQYPSLQGGVGVDAAGNFVVTWTSYGSAASDQSSRSIHAQRYATGRTVLGKKILVKDPTGSEIQRTVIALGNETATDVGATILGDPTVNGATLRVITKGTVDSNESYVLDASGWSVLGAVGFRYTGPTGGDGDPVKKVILKRTPGGKALVKALLKGNVGTQNMNVVPPNSGDEGGIILTVNGGGTYCVSLGGAAGGSETLDSAQSWKMINAGAELCETP